MSELSDLVKAWQSDLHVLKDNRADEMAEIKSTTSRMFKKLDAGSATVPEESWLSTRLLSVQVAGLGLAIPLLDIRSMGRRGSEEPVQPIVPALLFSIRAIEFVNKRNETARFTLQRMALQFAEKCVLFPGAELIDVGLTKVFRNTSPAISTRQPIECLFHH